MSKIKIAAVPYHFRKIDHLNEYRAKIFNICAEVKEKNADLLLFPEYASIELASLFPSSQHNLEKQIEQMQSLFADYISLFCHASQTYRLHICSGTFLVKDGSFYKNRSYFFAPSGRWDHQDKLQLTRFERETGLIQKGDEIKVFSTSLGKIGIAICYDSEFPPVIRKQVEQGAKILLVPSCTDTVSGFYRVNVSCRARAIENQCYVIQTPTIGEVPWSEIIDQNCGLPGIYTPADIGFPSNGILAEGEWNKEEILYADLHLSLIDEVRKSGHVLNHQDWSDLPERVSKPVKEYLLS